MKNPPPLDLNLPAQKPAPMRDIAEELLARGREAQARADAVRAAERAAMSPEQLMKLEKQIEAAKKRGNEGENVRERLRELRTAHFDGNGSTGG